MKGENIQNTSTPSQFHFKVENNNKVLKDGRKQTDKVNKPSNYSTGTTERTAEYHCQPQALREMCGGHDV